VVPGRHAGENTCQPVKKKVPLVWRVVQGGLSAGLQTGQTAGALSDSGRSCVKNSAGGNTEEIKESIRAMLDNGEVGPVKISAYLT